MYVCLLTVIFITKAYYAKYITEIYILHKYRLNIRISQCYTVNEFFKGSIYMRFYKLYIKEMKGLKRRR